MDTFVDHLWGREIPATPKLSSVIVNERGEAAEKSAHKPFKRIIPQFLGKTRYLIGEPWQEFLSITAEV